MVVEKGVRFWLCPQCPQKSTRGSDMVRHMRIHSGDRPYGCEMCGKSYSLRSTLQQHLRHHLGITAERCHICLKALATASALRKHLKLHNRQSLSCPLCSDSFPTPAKLKFHAEKCGKSRDRNVAGSSVPLQEPLIETETGEWIQWVSRRETLPHSNRQNSCHLCPAAYRREKHLKDHLKTAHGDGASYHCRQCGRSFLASRYLREHLKRHSGRKPFSCVHCSKAFPTLGALRRHSVIHSHRRPFICPYCQKRFKRGTLCRKHIRSVHKDCVLPPPGLLVEPSILPNTRPPEYHTISTYPDPAWFRDDMLFNSDQNPPFVSEPDLTAFNVSIEDAVPHLEPSTDLLELSSVIGGVLGPDARIENSEVQDIVLTDTVQTVFGCPICGHRMDEMNQFLNHIGAVHSTERHFQFSCPKCAELEMGSARFIQHMTCIHGDTILQEAKRDDRVLPLLGGESEDVLLQLDDVHEEYIEKRMVDSSRNKVCHLCGKSFRKGNDLDRHLRIHTGQSQKEPHF